jgi:hypothetical protein
VSPLLAPSIYYKYSLEIETMKKEMANLFSKTLNMREKGTLSVTNLEKTLLHSSK